VIFSLERNQFYARVTHVRVTKLKSQESVLDSQVTHCAARNANQLHDKAKDVNFFFVTRKFVNKTYVFIFSFLYNTYIV